MSPQKLRRTMRRYRRALTPAEQQSASSSIVKRICSQPCLLKSDNIGLYWPNDGEIDLRKLPKTLNQRFWLPVILPGSHMTFARYTSNTRLTRNRFGIPEPADWRHQQIPSRQLDLVLMPLVAFDKHGRRLGMGGGYYDRCFAFLNQRKCWHKPKLVGVAYELQRVETLPERTWDVRMDAVVTETQWIDFVKPVTS